MNPFVGLSGTGGTGKIMGTSAVIKEALAQCVGISPQYVGLSGRYGQTPGLLGNPGLQCLHLGTQITPEGIRSGMDLCSTSALKVDHAVFKPGLQILYALCILKVAG